MKATTDFLGWSERDAIRTAVFARDVPLCVWCQEVVGDHRSDRYYHVDHVTPRSEGGPYCTDNLVLSCKNCNAARRNLSVLQFMALRAGCSSIAV
ncbi:HNH endonuclease [Rhizobium bangladeshense]|nr:HNH endonuclease [Rhizobium bangladeshense]MBX4872687.1 HNH endonuclease [Rhizobium bangladeshense]